MIVSFLPEPDKHPLWPAIKELLRPASEGEFTLFDDELVWIAFEGTTVFGAGSAAPYDDTTAIILTAGGARHKEWIEQAVAAVSAWARMNGATKLIMRGRKGWGRYLRPFGWGVSETDEAGRYLYEKDLPA